MTEREFETIIDKINVLTEKVEFYSEKLDLYKQVSDEKLEAFKKSSDEQINAIRSEIKGYQDANKQQLNVSLGVLVTAAVAILVSVILSMNN
ncbi:hypothetical protein [Crocosphaera sp.]|uniref:hypothetical protein n=1 Tax=Crocosphaera sp. TaxID=2729996 RepID=UPI003F2703C1|nr:hypothetical protein [Crocosphaera sp.]